MNGWRLQRGAWRVARAKELWCIHLEFVWMIKDRRGGKFTLAALLLAFRGFFSMDIQESMNFD